MATLVSLQLVRVASVGDHPATLHCTPKRFSSVVSNSRLCQGSGLKISSQPKGGSFQGGGLLHSPLWSHPLVPRSSPHVQAVRMPTSALSIRPVAYEQEIKPVVKKFATYGTHLLKRIATLVQLCPPLVAQIAPAVSLVAFSVWGLGPTTRLLRKNVFKRSDKKWDESRSNSIIASYMRPILLWIGIILICRACDPVVLSTEASQIIKQRFVNFVRSLSTVLAFAFCTASLTKQVQRFMMENQDAEESRNVGVKFIGNTVYTSVWIAAVCLFMELLGFSTQKWITAGGFGTVLLTLAGREIFTNFLSSIMIHATRPFVDNEWIQTKIEGQEVSGTVEHVGWWSPTVIRGDDREAVHIPNHKFSVSVVRNLSQKTHWRIKTHLGISHLDVNKLTPIVADMRKVLAKHPQIEQQRLHRRVFLDNVDPENQALLILVSCFVKTSHFEEYLRVKEAVLLDLLKVISHHNARLATQIRSVQRVVDESKSRNAGSREMQNANQAQQRPHLLLNSEVVTTSDYEEDDNDNISYEIARLRSAQFAKVAKPLSAKSNEDSGSETNGFVEERSGLRTSSEVRKPNRNIPANNGNSRAGSSRIPVSAQESTKDPAFYESLSQDSAWTENTNFDVHETLMDRIHAGTEGRLVRSHTGTDLPQSHGKKGNATPVAATHVPPTNVAIEISEEQVPHLYSNNIGNDVETTLAETSDDKGNENTVRSSKMNVYVRSGLPDQAGSALLTGIGDQKEKSLTRTVNDKHLGVHVAVESDNASASQTSKGNVSDKGIGAASPVSSTDPWSRYSTTRISNKSLVSSSPRSSDDDLWKQPSNSQGHNSKKTRTCVDPNLLIPGVAIEGPKHTIPLDEDFIIRDDLRTLVALVKPTGNIKDRRESSKHGAVSKDTLDRER